MSLPSPHLRRTGGSLVGVAALALPLFVGCSGYGQHDKGSSPATQHTATPSAPDADNAAANSTAGPTDALTPRNPTDALHTEAIKDAQNVLNATDPSALARLVGATTPEALDPAFAQAVADLQLTMDADSVTVLDERVWEVTAQDRHGMLWTVGFYNDPTGAPVLVWAELAGQR